MGSSFIEVVLNGEEQLLARILADAEANGHFGSASPDPEAWRPAVRGISGSIAQAYRNSEEPSPLAAEEMGKDDGLSAFLVVEARKRRLGGMPLGSFLGLLKLIRRAYADRIRSAGHPPNEEARHRLFIDRFFDRNEAAVCVSWAVESSREQEEALVGMRNELARVHDLVAAAKEELEGTIDCLDAMILLADGTGRILRCNLAFRRFVDRPYKEILGRPLAQVLGENGMPAAVADAQAVEHFHERLGRWFVLRFCPFRQDPAAEVSGTVVAIRDATEIKTAAAELERGTARLQETLSDLRRAHAETLEREKTAAAGRMAEGVARDIGRPAGVVVNNLATLWKRLPRLAEFLSEQSACIAAGSPPRLVESVRRKREELNLDSLLGDLPDLLGETLEEAERVRAVADELKAFARPQDSDFREADLNQCLQDALHAARDRFKGRATLDRSFGDIRPTRCLPAPMTRVFTDLLADAARAVRSPGVVRIRSWLEDGFICVSVGDPAREIPKERLAHVFEPFRQAGGDGREEGLGLSAAYEIVRKHRGVIRVRSENGKGTTFTVAVPMVKGD